MECLIEKIDDLPNDLTSENPVILEEKELDIVINNITSSFKVEGEIDFKKVPKKYITISLTQKAISIKADDCTILIRLSGKSLCMGASSEDQALSAAKKSVEILKSWGIDATFNDYKIISLFCTCLLPWRIRVEAMVAKYHKDFTYEPEIHNYCSLKMEKGQGFIGVYATGFIRVIGFTVEMVLNILEKALPFLSEFRI